MKIKILLLALFCGFLSFGQVIYQHDFGTTAISAKPYTVAPTTFDANLNTSSWTTSAAGFAGFAGNGGGTSGSLSLNNSSGTPTMTLTFNVAAGFQMTVNQFDFWRVRSAAGAQNWSMTINGTSVGTGTVPTTGALLGVTNVSNPINNLTGTITIVITMSGATGAGTFRLDDFTLIGTVTSACASPSTQATAFSATSVTATTATLNWTRGNGTNILVVARAASAVNADPVFSNSYAFDASFGLGTEIGIGNFAVYNGTGTSVNLTGLTSGTTYYLAIYEYNSGTLCYNTIKLTGNFTTPVILPNVLLSDNGTQIAAGNVAQNSIDNIISSFKIDVTGNTANLTQAVFNLTGTYLAADIVANGFKIWYNTTNDFFTATSIKTLSSSSTGSGESLFFTGLSQSIPIGQGYFWITASITPTATVNRTIQVNAISSSASLTFATINSNTGSGSLAGLQTISPTAPNVAATFTKICTSNNSQSLSWTAPSSGAYDGYLLVVREANAPHAVTSILTTTPQNLNYSLAQTYGSTAVLSRILYLGTATNATVTGLTPGVSYTFAIYTYKISTSPNAIYSVAKTTTQIVALPNVNSASASAGNSSASLNWVNPSVACYDQILVVATSASGITFVPTGNGSAYNPNTVYSATNQIVYGSSGNLVTVFGLTNGVTYYFEIFVRNGTQWSSGVEVAVTPSPIAPTILKTGDLLLIAYTNKTTTSADDSIRLLSLVDINPGTKFLWANATYETGGNPAANVRTDKWFDCTTLPTGNVPYLEFTYTGSTIIPAASVFCIRTVSAGTGSTISVSFPVSGSSSSFTIVGKSANGATLLSHGSVNVSTSAPDAMFLMQGNFNYSPTGSTFVGTILSAIQDGALWYDLTDDLTATSGNNLRKSRKHPQLLCASIQANLSPAAYQVSYNVSSSTYTTGSRSYLLGSILNYGTNWLSSFGVCPATSPFVISASDPFNRWTGSANTNWFDCNNWALLSVPDELTDVTIAAPVPNNPTISYLAPISDSFLDVAKCKNLTISGSTLKIEGTIANPTGIPFNSRLEVRENLIINGTGVLDMDDSNSATADGELSLIGNWTNSLGINSFLEGNGTVKFIGSATQVINNNLHTGTEEFYNVVLDNDFNTLNSNNLIATGNLEIKPNKNVTIASNEYIQASKNLLNDGSLTVKDSGMLYQTDDSGIDSGNINVERNANIRLLDYVYWSSPISGFNVNDIYSTLTPTGLIYKWDTTFSPNPNGGEGYWQPAAGNIMTAGKGFIVRGPSSYNNAAPQSILSTFNNGVPNNGVVPFLIKRGNMTPATLSSYTSANGVAFTFNDDNSNLVGNPYPSAISANAFLQYNAVTVPIIEGAVRIWTHGTLPVSTQNPFYASYAYNYTANDYITYNGTATISGPTGFNGNIATGQGFFVLMNDGLAGSANLIFNNSMRVKNNNSNSQFYKNATDPVENLDIDKSRIWLDLISSNSVVRTVVGYVPNATLEKDAMYDAYTRIGANNIFYSLINQEVMCIQGRPLPFDVNDQVPLGMKVISTVFNNYTIAISAVDGLFETQNIYLEDKLLNVIHNLKETPYNFTSSTGIFDDRFVLRYTENALVNTTFESSNSNVIVIGEKNKITIKSLKENISSVRIYDILGREIAKQENLNNKEILFENILKNQPLIVKIQLENKEIVTKKIVL
jgi:Fibronectin type III domain